MAIAQTNNGMGTFGASPNTLAATTSGSDRVLIAATWANLGYATGVTYNGVAMTKVQDLQGSGSSYYLTLWILVNPTTGTNNLVASVASGNVQVAYDAFSGSTALTYDSLATNTNVNSSSIASSNSVVTANSWLISAGSCDGNPTGGGGTNFTLRNTAGNWVLGDSNATVGTGAQTASIPCNSGAGNFNAIITISLAPTAPASSPSFSKNLFSRQAVNRASSY